MSAPAPKVIDIVRATAAEYGLTVEGLRTLDRGAGPRRGPAQEARMVASFVARRLTKASLRQISERLGDRDPGSVHGREATCARRILVDDDLRHTVARVVAVATANVTVIRERDLPARLAQERESRP